ncbi:MAG: T9SS type A sorting domain-containing protein [Calditrichaeota bacterium]|nr:T9SS type A sorting domain-containing protein [Calditrichota bacterium]
MRKVLLCFGSALLWFGISFSAVYAQTPKAQIRIESLSPIQLAERNWTTSPSSGLSNVGKGELIYLSGHNLSSEPVVAFSWSFQSLPAGSNATLDSTNTQWTTFRPDTTGQFVVKLEITTASGTADTTVTITSAKYVGVGGIAGLPSDPSKGQCSLCHSGKTAEWQGTGHATMFQEAIDGQKSSHYAGYCIECHTVGYDTDSTAVNGGFDDVAKELGWTFPAVLQAGNWDSLVTNYPDLAQKANIQCENCHGPGSLHKGNTSNIAVSLREGVCAKCHGEEPYHRRSLQWSRSAHAVGVSFAANREGCAECHSGYGFIHKIDPNSALEKTTGFPQTTCAVCHDPHSADVEHQLRTEADVTLKNGDVISFGGAGKLCMNCHHARQDAATYSNAYHPHYGPHHSPQADMLAGTNAVTFGMNIPSSNHKNVVKDACVTCHMGATPATGKPGHDYVGAHTFAMHWTNPQDSTQEVDNVAPCQTCHGNITSFDDIMAKKDYDGDGTIESAQDEVAGLLDEVGKLLPPLGDPKVVESSAYTPVQLKAAYNYEFVKNDGSYGIHNFQYAVNLLKASYEALTTGNIGAGTIVSITDVPNDQGKKVRVVWTKFGGDGIGVNPIQQYVLWRRVDDRTNGTNGKEIPVYESLESVPLNLITTLPGARVMINGQLWDFAGSVPASAQKTYSAIAPTLFDSTKTKGMYWSVFRISGLTKIPAVYTTSAPDSGYSVDNLSPAVPGDIMATETQTGAELSWNKPVDEDFNYFAIYRSTTPGFDPANTEPYATTTENKFSDNNVAMGNSYYYRLSAFDFSGNQSAFSKEIALTITKVNDTPRTTIPNQFVLKQNFPNPFNPSTKITFGLPSSEQTTLAIYNLLGAKVRLLAQGKFSAGYHSIVWDGRDDRGRVVGPGIYLYRLQSGSRILVNKMIFMK